jgi:hypothetical protein
MCGLFSVLIPERTKMTDTLSPLEATALTLQIERRGCSIRAIPIFDDHLCPTRPTQYEVKIFSDKVHAAIAVGCGRTHQEALEFAYGVLLQRESAFCVGCGL